MQTLVKKTVRNSMYSVREARSFPEHPKVQKSTQGLFDFNCVCAGIKPLHQTC